MDFVIIESPFAGATPSETEANLKYGVECLHNSLLRGEAPFGSHLLYPLCLDDKKPAEREAGILAGFAVMARSDFSAVYIDRGISPGMRRGIENALGLGHRVVYRTNKKPTEDLRFALSGAL